MSPVLTQDRSTPMIAGYRDFTYSGGNVTSEPTAQKPESKMWNTDSQWWAIMWSSSALSYRIFRLDFASQSWIDTGVAVDERGRSSQDAYWDEGINKLYVASSAKPNAGGAVEARLYRYSYDAFGDTYILDNGFPSVIYSNKSATLVIAKDSNGHLWANWTHVARVWLNRSTDDGQTWETPFELPVQGNDIKINPDDATTTQDISSIISFGGNRIGVLWSNQVDARYYFSFHLDSQPDPMAWQPRETAFENATLPNAADDHVNLTTSDEGYILAAVKHSADAGPQPLITVLKRDPATGAWSNSVFGQRTDQHTRAIVMLDSETDSVYVFASSERASPGSIYVKSAHLSTLDFPTGLGRVFLRSFTADDRANNPTSTKQHVTSSTGLFVLASDDNGPERYYFHNYMALGGNARPVARDDAVSAPVNTPTAINILANDSDDRAIDAASVQIVTAPANGDVTLDPGTGLATYTGNPDFSGNDSLTYTIKDHDGESALAATVTIAVGLQGPQVSLVLESNYPNPFDGETNISYFISSSTNVRLAIYNLNGQRICTLYNGPITAGFHSAVWDGKNDQGMKVSSGVYLFSLATGDQVVATKLVLAR